MIKPCVSVIIPVYGTSSYIEKCAHSLFSQTLKNTEYIFVNDATTDDSIQKLEKVRGLYPEIADRVKILHHLQNSGTAIARNTALNHATGDFILMVDSDDYIDKDMLSSLYNKAIETNADIVVSDFYIEYKNKTVYFTDYLSSNHEEHFKDILSCEKSSPSLCNKLIKRELYLIPENRNVLPMKYMEDRFVVSRLYFSARKIIKTDAAFYHYVKLNCYSATNKINSTHFDDTLVFWSTMDEFLLKNRVNDKYSTLVGNLKLKDKIKLMFNTMSVENRKLYAGMFIKEEKLYKNQFRLVERIMLKLIELKMFRLTGLLRSLVFVKNNIFNFTSH